jgi:hypothetical protein
VLVLGLAIVIVIVIVIVLDRGSNSGNDAADMALGLRPRKARRVPPGGPIQQLGGRAARRITEKQPNQRNQTSAFTGETLEKLPEFTGRREDEKEVFIRFPSELPAFL